MSKAAAMGKRKASEQENEQNKKGLQLEPGFFPVQLEDVLECSSAADDKNKELWLLQIPEYFPLEEKIVWQALQPGAKRLDAICQIEDAGYRLVEERELGATPVYAVSGDSFEPVRISRRVGIYRQTDAPKVCFGIDDVVPMEDEEREARTPAKLAKQATETPIKKVKKEKKDKDKKKKKRDEDGGEPDTEQKKKKSKKK